MRGSNISRGISDNIFVASSLCAAEVVHGPIVRPHWPQTSTQSKESLSLMREKTWKLGHMLKRLFSSRRSQWRNLKRAKCALSCNTRHQALVFWHRERSNIPLYGKGTWWVMGMGTFVLNMLPWDQGGEWVDHWVPFAGGKMYWQTLGTTIFVSRAWQLFLTIFRGAESKTDLSFLSSSFFLAIGFLFSLENMKSME